MGKISSKGATRGHEVIFWTKYTGVNEEEQNKNKMVLGGFSGSYLKNHSFIYFFKGRFLKKSLGKPGLNIYRSP